MGANGGQGGTPPRTHLGGQGAQQLLQGALHFAFQPLSIWEGDRGGDTSAPMGGTEPTSIPSTHGWH